ncbi:MAG: DUF4091 domain-containing protein, partial [Anaerorhabdus sp.]
MRKLFKGLKIFSTIGMCLCMGVTNTDLSILANTKSDNAIETIVGNNTIGNELNQITYEGNWVSSNNDHCVGGVEHYTSNDYSEIAPAYSMKFKGTQIEIFAIKDSGHGIMSVSIDGNEVGDFDLYSQTRIENASVFKSETVSNVEHTLKVTLKEKGNASVEKDHPNGHLDYIKVYSPKVVPTAVSINTSDFSINAGETKQLTATIEPAGAINNEIEFLSSDDSVASINKDGLLTAVGNGAITVQARIKGTQIVSTSINVTVKGNEKSNYLDIVDDNTTSPLGYKFKFQNNWGIDSGYPDSFFNGTNHYSTKNSYGDKPAVATLDFYGKGIEVFGNKDREECIYKITIDGKDMGEADAFFDGDRKTQQLLFETQDLEEKEHTIRIETTDKVNEKADSNSIKAISIDYAKVYRDTKDIVATDLNIEAKKIKLDEGSQKDINVVYTPVYATLKEAKWTTSNDEVASVTNGTIIAKKAGKTTITATLPNGKSQALEVEVVSADYKVRAMFGNSDLHYLQKDYKSITDSYSSESAAFDSGFGWQGDIINAELVTWTKNDPVSNLTIEATDFTNNKGKSFSKNNISIKYLKETSVAYGGASSSAPHTDVPDIIYGGEMKNVVANRIQSAWINITVPNDVESGVYSGVIKVKADEMDKALEVPYSFEVFNLSQPKKSEYQGGVEIWEYPYAVAKYYGIEDKDLFNDKHLKLLEQNVEQYAAVGGNVITTAITDYPWARNNPYDYPSTIRWSKETDGTFSFDFKQFDTWVQFNLDHGVGDKLKCFSMSPYYNIRYFDKKSGQYEEEPVSIGSDRYKEVWGQFMKEFVPHLDEKDWFDMTYTAMDEVGPDNINAVADLVANYPNKDGKIMKLSAAVNYGGLNQETLDRITDISMALSHLSSDSDKISADRREKGLYTSFYTCVSIYPNSFAFSDPGESAWTMWKTGESGVDGFLRWAGDNWLHDPYTNLDWTSWESGDTMLVYPDDNKTAENPQLRTTPRFEKLKEGKRDIEKMFYLRDNYPDLKDEINDLLGSLQTNNAGWTSQEGKDFLESELLRMRVGLKEISGKAEKLTPIQTTTLRVEPKHTEQGTVSVKGSNKKGEKAILNAQAKEGYVFVDWATRSGKVLSRDQEYIFTVTKDMDIVAEFKKESYLEALKIKVEEAERIIENSKDYKPESISGLNEAIASAKKAINDADEEKAKISLGNLTNALSKVELIVNKTSLKTAIDDAKKISKDDYTPSSFKIFEKAISDAEKVLVDENATQTNVNKEVEILSDAKNKLQKIANTESLVKKISTAKEINKDSYVSTSIKILEDAITKAEKVLVNKEATQTEVNSVITDLDKALNNLCKKGETKKLVLALNSIKKNNNYSKDTWDAYETAIKNAKAVINNKDASQKEIDEALSDLEKAEASLRENEIEIDKVPGDKTNQTEPTQTESTEKGSTETG